MSVSLPDCIHKQMCIYMYIYIRVMCKYIYIYVCVLSLSVMHMFVLCLFATLQKFKSGSRNRIYLMKYSRSSFTHYAIQLLETVETGLRIACEWVICLPRPAIRPNASNPEGPYTLPLWN